MSENIPFLREKMIPLNEVQKLMDGSYEQMTALMDSAVKSNRSLFVAEDSDEDVARLATFPDRVIVGTSGGKYFEAKFKEKDGGFVLESADSLDVPVVDQKNVGDYVRNYTLETVDALLSEDQDSVKERILALAGLQEDHQVQAERDYVEDVVDHIGGARPWRHVFHDKSSDIQRQVVDRIDAIRESQLEAKYKPLYETDDIPEETFEDYRDLVNADLSVMTDRLEKVQHTVETLYLPFAESVVGAEVSEEEGEVISHFRFFSEDLVEDLQELRQIVAEAVQNEQCVMCLGQIYDSLTETLADYEIAGAFVERMITAFDEAA